MTVLVVMGVSGSGKSTLARALAAQLGWPWIDGDDLHPAANLAKMSAGQPLGDEDRWPWLQRVRAWIDAREAAGEDGVVACSALKRRYRAVLDQDGADRAVRFIHLTGPRAELQARLQGRAGHFMPAALLDSQLADLEPLGPDEAGITVQLDPTHPG